MQQLGGGTNTHLGLQEINLSLLKSAKESDKKIVFVLTTNKNGKFVDSCCGLCSFGHVFGCSQCSDVTCGVIGVACCF